MNEHEVRRYAEPYQPTSPREWNWSVMLGTATPMMRRSKAMRNAVRNIGVRIAITLRVGGYAALDVGCECSSSSAWSWSWSIALSG